MVHLERVNNTPKSTYLQVFKSDQSKWFLISSKSTEFIAKNILPTFLILLHNIWMEKIATGFFDQFEFLKCQQKSIYFE